MLRTTCYNATWFILPVPKASVQSLVPYPLITPPFSDKPIFLNNFPPNTHPVVVATGYQNDIRMVNLEIPSLLGGNVYIPYTDYLRDGKTPFQYAVKNYIGGVNDQDVQALVPFKQVIVQNQLSGPSVKPEAFDLLFMTAKTPLYAERTFHVMANQPQIQNNKLLCQRNTYYINETFAEPKLRSGNVTVYSPPTGALPSALMGKYIRQGGYSASAEMVGYNPESCKHAAANVDPKASQ
ncbi:MAG: hypothetical protein Q9209_005508 [Squamulea sp. 1 TL-2023]